MGKNYGSCSSFVSNESQHASTRQLQFDISLIIPSSRIVLVFEFPTVLYCRSKLVHWDYGDTYVVVEYLLAWFILKDHCQRCGPVLVRQAVHTSVWELNNMRQYHIRQSSNLQWSLPGVRRFNHKRSSKTKDEITGGLDALGGCVHVTLNKDH